MIPFRTGYGCDLHRFVPDRKLVLCGVEIPHTAGLLGHSDADAACHALTDALLGALALGDIGHFFPDDDPAYKDADSVELLKKVLQHKAFESWMIGNCDITIITQKPKLAPHINAMRESLSTILGIDISNVSVKAKTAEGLDAVGRCEALEARCIVLLAKRD